MTELIVIHPEIAAAALKAHVADLYFAWLVAKQIDRRQGSSGKVEVNDLLAILVRTLGVGEKSAYAKIKKGVGIFWTAPGGATRKRVTVLLGAQRVIDNLAPTMPRSEPFRLPINDLMQEFGEWNTLALRQFFLSCVASRHVDRRPMSLASIMEHTGLSESTVRNQLKNSPWVVRVANYKKLFEDHNQHQARTKLNQSRRFSRGVRMDFVGGVYCVMKQLPNTYLMPSVERLALRKRPQALKNLDGFLMSSASPRMYFNAKSTVVESGIKPDAPTHLWVGDQKQYVYLWRDNRGLPPSSPTVLSPRLRARIALGFLSFVAEETHDNIERI